MRKRRFFKCSFTIHTLFLRLRFRLIRQRNTVHSGLTSAARSEKLGPAIFFRAGSVSDGCFLAQAHTTFYCISLQA
jgi:hypothetical protein